VNLVVISACSTIDRQIIGRLRRRWPETEVIRPIGMTGSGREDVARWARSPATTSRRRYQRVRERHRLRSLRSALPDMLATSTVAPLRLPAGDLNRPEGIRRVRDLHPDVLILCGAPILREGLLSVPSIGTMNVHFGYSPHYRGEHTLFHALRRRDYEHLGVTIHGVDLGVDTGPLLIQANPMLEPSDHETSILGKCALLAGEMLVEALETVERRGALVGREQTETGALYRRDDRRVLDDLIEVMSRRLLGRRPPHRAERIVRYDECLVETDES
jgi:methionyl-tRNA formyltransferase